MVWSWLSPATISGLVAPGTWVTNQIDEHRHERILLTRHMAAEGASEQCSRSESDQKKDLSGEIIRRRCKHRSILIEEEMPYGSSNSLDRRR